MVKLKEPTFKQNLNSDKMNHFLSIARFSPSSHNTQPWLVKIEGDKLIIGYNPDRQLHVGDPQKKELFISLGCFVETFMLAAKEVGYDTDYVFHGDTSDKVASLQLKKSKKSESGWEELIKLRRSDRRFYEAKEIPEETLDSLRNLSNKHARLLVFENPADINFLAQMTHQATAQIMSTQDFRDELASWVRNNWTKRPDGMPAYTQGMPGPVSLLAKFVIRKNKRVAKDQAKKDSQRVKHSSAIGLICVDRDAPAMWIEAGKLYQLTCLTALQKDIKTSAVSAAVILSETKKQIIEKLQLSQTPVALIRFGYTKDISRATPRLAVREFSKSN